MAVYFISNHFLCLALVVRNIRPERTVLESVCLCLHQFRRHDVVIADIQRHHQFYHNALTRLQCSGELEVDDLPVQYVGGDRFCHKVGVGILFLIHGNIGLFYVCIGFCLYIYISQ